MKKILDLLSAEVAKAFAAAGYDEKYARVSIPTVRTSVNISVTEPWRQRKSTTKRRL